MRNKNPEAAQKRGAKKVISILAERDVSVTPAVLPPSFCGGPPPEALYHEAESEPDHRALAQYVDSIRVLRNKSFSYREIADWLSARGVEADHNAVYRVYTKNLSDYHAALEAEREAEEERDEALRNS